ncbi:MAG: radical SAM protein [Clostridia bacterium]|nr:radical SAM protein [Clostridia bacterium]
MKKHINIPVFIPHLGCPNQCVFCDQHTISGACSFIRENAGKTIEEALTTISADADCEIAFFGGSFTGIDRGLMTDLLDMAQTYVHSGRVSGIRMSTRPDYIDEEILCILSRYTVAAVELGIQSMDDGVLAVCRRGHRAADTEKACRMLGEAGISWAGQMMIGLPGASPETERQCAERICRMGASACRIYPTIVLHHTELARMTASGAYTPLTVEEAAERSSAVLEIFLAHGVECLRIGLCDSETLHDPDACMAGPVHPAMGELTASRIYLHRIEEAIEALFLENPAMTGAELTVSVPCGEISKAVGQRRANILEIERKYPVKLRKFLENPEQIRYNIQLGIFSQSDRK